MLGLEGAEAGCQVSGENSGLNPDPAVETGNLESIGSKRNAWCSGEMHRYHAEPRLRRQLTTLPLTLKHESVGIKQD